MLTGDFNYPDIDYVRSRSRAKTTVSTLVDSHGVTTVQPHDLAEEFNKYFAFVFTVENMDNLPDADKIFTGLEKDKLSHIQVTKELVRKQFDKMRSDKAAGADVISPKFLIELKEELCLPVTLIMTASLKSGIVPED